MRKPQKPFYFNTSEHLLRIGREEAGTLSELRHAIETCPEDSIFQHTFRTLQEHQDAGALTKEKRLVGTQSEGAFDHLERFTIVCWLVGESACQKEARVRVFRILPDRLSEEGFRLVQSSLLDEKPRTLQRVIHKG